jgi:hypothetical protein
MATAPLSSTDGIIDRQVAERVLDRVLRIRGATGLGPQVAAVVDRPAELKPRLLGAVERVLRVTRS